MCAIPVRPRRCRIAGFVAICLATLVMGQTAQAGLIDVTKNFTVIGTNFPTNFTESVAISSSPTLINSGQLSLRTTIFADGPNAEWVDVSFATTNGGPLAGNINNLWRVELDNLQMTQPTSLDALYFYWTINGVAVNPIFPLGSFPPPIPNPIDPLLGPAYVAIFPPFAFGTTLNDINAFSSPYSFISSGGMDPNQVNDFHLGFHFTATNPTAVPEPSSLTLLGIGLGVIAWSRRRKLVEA